MKGYQTKDLYLATYLQSEGKQALLAKGSDGKFTFEFEDGDELRTMISTFYERQARVEPMNFAVSMKQLKSMMYNYGG